MVPSVKDGYALALDNKVFIIKPSFTRTNNRLIECELSQFPFAKSRLGFVPMICETVDCCRLCTLVCKATI